MSTRKRFRRCTRIRPTPILIRCLTIRTLLFSADRRILKKYENTSTESTSFEDYK
ncbi:Hypothetical protein CINCED_3A017587 [Cinara cedri]|uniref:Uncharacterized protein n=1 Tax=Cinara cedri TaxID=506608 RepID=A0A5E4MXL0_9HEMI|nr:Hypothetical protein CINCED_3A017587 [Cinara cedri]